MKTKNIKAKKRLGPSRRGILVKGSWKAVELDPSIFANEAMGEVVCFEELTDYSLVDSEKTAGVTQLDTGDRKKRKTKRKARELEAEEHDLEEDWDKLVQLSSEDSPAKKRKKKKKKHEADDVLTGEDIESLAEEEGQILQDSDDYAELTAETAQKAKKKKKKRKKKKLETAENKETDAQVSPPNQAQAVSKRKAKNWADVALSKTAGQDTDVSAWKELFVPEPVLKALSKLGFSAPTPIQALALPPAIRDHLDVLGAAETGKVPRVGFASTLV